MTRSRRAPRRQTLNDVLLRLVAVSVRFYASRFGTYRLINQDGNDMSIYPPEKDDEWDMSRVGHRLARMLRRAQSEQTAWKPVGVDEDFGYIFERVKGLT